MPRTVWCAMASNWQPFDTAPAQGVFLVYLEEESLGSLVQVMNRRKNVSTIASNFAFDMPKPLYWQPQPDPPEDIT